MMIVLYIGIGIVIGGIAGVLFMKFIRTPHNLDEHTEAVTWSSQQLLIMYLVTDEMYRTRLIKWMKSEQAMRYSDAVADSLGGKLFLLPVDDKKTMEELITQLVGVDESVDNNS